MSLSDPIADMLTRIRNALLAKHENVRFPSSRLKVDILKILKKEGFIKSYHIEKLAKKDELNVILKYHHQKPVIKKIYRVSRPGLRNYTKTKDLQPVRNNMGIAILSTPKGVITGRDAKKLNVGGEIICRLW